MLSPVTWLGVSVNLKPVEQSIVAVAEAVAEAVEEAVEEAVVVPVPVEVADPMTVPIAVEPEGCRLLPEISGAAALEETAPPSARPTAHKVTSSIIGKVVKLARPEGLLRWRSHCCCIVVVPYI
jgi:hypothetical protein